MIMRTIAAALAASALLGAIGCGSKTTQDAAEGGKPATDPSAATSHAASAAHDPTSAYPTPRQTSATGDSFPGSPASSADTGAPKNATPQDHIARGIRFSELGRRREAIAAYTAALRLDANNLSALLYRGGEYYALQEMDAAEKDIEQALTSDPAYAEAYILRAHLAGVRHDYQAAVDDFYRALKHPERDANFTKYFGDKKDVVAHVYLAAAFSECPDLSFRNDAKAFEHALQACQLDAWRSRRYVSVLVNAIAGSKSQEDALSRQEQAIAAAPTESIKEQLRGAVEAFNLRSEFPLR